MKFNLLTLTLQHFIAAFSGGAARLSTAANALLGMLAVIDIVLFGMWWALDGSDRLSAAFRKILHLGFWLWLVKGSPELAKTFVDSLVSAGQLAGGGSGDMSLLLDPSRIAGYGLDATEPLVKKFEDLHITEFADGIVYGLAYLAIMGSFLIMAMHVFVAVLEYYLITAIVVILLPFGLLQSTKFLAEKAIGAVVAVGIKLMVLSFLLAAIEPVLAESMKLSSADVPMNELFAMFLTSGALLLLVWKAPNLAASLISGSPNLGAADMTAPAAAMVGVAVGAMTAGASYVAARAAATSSDGGSMARSAGTPPAGAGSGSEGGGFPFGARRSEGSKSGGSDAGSGGGNREGARGSSQASAAAPTLVMSCQSAPTVAAPFPELAITRVAPEASAGVPAPESAARTIPDRTLASPT